MKLIRPKKKWTIHQPDNSIVHTFMQELSLPSLHAKILASRGFTNCEEVERFLHITAENLHDPYHLYDMDKAVQLIQNAIEEKKTIAVYGDYDADGITSVAVLTTALKRLHANVQVAIPNRFEHGYGPNKQLFQQLSDDGVELLITVDNGIAAIEEIAFAKQLGLTVIITDHHEIGEALPEADAIIHPRHPSGQYPFGELAGVGVAYKLSSALLNDQALDLLEFVAIGTVADLVPLKDENRFFVKEGIRRLRLSNRPAIRALASESSVEQREITEETIGFAFGPRLNAPGRLGDAEIAVSLLLSTDKADAQSLADQLNTMNKERQAIVKALTEEAFATIESTYGDDMPHVLVIEGEGWNPGVVGIVASRLVEAFYRPTIILSTNSETGIAKGSARSIEGYDLYKALASNEELLMQFGGHQMAAGLTVQMDAIQQLREQLNHQAEKLLTKEIMTPCYHIDVSLTIDEIDVEVLESLELLKPFGVSFEKPAFVIEGVTASSMRKIGALKNHLKLEVTKNDEVLDVIGFNNGSIADELAPTSTLSVAGDLQVNEWNGHKKPQLLLEDLSCDEWQLFDLRGSRDVVKWLPVIPQQKTAFIAFQPQTIAHFAPQLKGIPIHLYDETELTNIEHAVLLDVPTNINQLTTFVKKASLHRIYVFFYVATSTYFEGMPDRQQFGWYYSFLKQREKFHIVEQADALAKHKGWKKETIYFMSKVFLELEFVKIENSLVSVVPQVVKRDLSESITYQQREQQMQLEELLLYSSYKELKQWFDELLRHSIAKEETLWI